MINLRLIFSMFLLLLSTYQATAQCLGTPPLAFTFESTESRCESNGTIILHITGGSPFTDGSGNPIYNNTVISPIIVPIGGQADSVFAAMAAGTYVVEVADANGCTATNSVTVPGTHMQLELTPTWSDATCDGLGGGWICGTPDEGRPWPPGFYRYQLFDATTSPPTPIGPIGLDSCFTDLAAGSYQIRAYDSCENFQTRDVLLAANTYDPSLLFANQRFVVNCDTGCIYFYPYIFSSRDPWGEFPYQWEVIGSNYPDVIGEMGQFDFHYDRDTLCFSPPYADNDSISFKITDACGNMTTQHAIVRPFRALARDILDTCSTTGDIVISPSYTPYCEDGTVMYEMTSAPIGFPLPPPQDTAFWPDLSDGTYCFKITDCCGNIATDCETIRAPFWTIRVDTSRIETCDSTLVGFRATGSFFIAFPIGLTTIVTSAPAGYLNSLPDTLPNYSSDITGPPGEYCITMYDFCNERDSLCVDVTKTPKYEPTVLVTPGCVTGNRLDISWTSNFFLQYDIWRATPSYDFMGNNTTQATWTNLLTGTYIIEWENDDNENCILRTDTFIIPEYVSPSITGVWGIECDNGVGLITVQGSGGNTPYTYELFQGPVTRPLQSSPNFPGLSNGTYDVRLNDNCNNSAIITVAIEPFNPVVKGYGGAFCEGDTAVIFVDYIELATYAWSGPNGNMSDTSILTIPNITLADAGTYTIDIDVKNPDQTACVAQTLTLEVEVMDCSCTLDAFNATMVDCNGAANGTVTANINSSSNPPFTYVWSNGATSQTISNLNPGNYSVTVTDAGGCSTTGDTLITQPSALTLTGIWTDVDCNGALNGSIDITPGGGTTVGMGCMDYSYSWSNIATTQDLNGLGAGTYTVTVTDCNGCFIVRSYTVVQPPVLSLSGTSTDISCNGLTDGNIDITPTGGSIMGGGGGGNVGLVAPIGGSQYSAFQDGLEFDVFNEITLDSVFVYNTGAGSITVNLLNSTGTIINTNTMPLQDRNGGRSVVPLGFIIPPGTGYRLNAVGTSGMTLHRTSGGATFPYTTSDVSITNAINGINGFYYFFYDWYYNGGCSSYSYQWSNGATTEDLTGLSAGTYTATLTDCNGCTAMQSYTIAEPLLLSSSVTGTDASCSGAADGSASATVTGGVMPYSYLWSNGATTSSINNLSGGTYTLTVTDANNCTTTSSTMISQASALTLTGTFTNVLCNGAANGSINITPGGGTTIGTNCTGYSYLWSNNATTQDLNSLAPGNYTVTLTDCNGCTMVRSYTISEPPALTLSGMSTNVLCNGAANGSIIITPGGGTTTGTNCTGYSYLWSNAATTQDISGLSAGTYTVTVVDCNSCAITGSYTISEAMMLSCAVTGTNVGCIGVSNGTAVASVTGGTMPYSYIWNTGEMTPMISNLSDGTYTVTVTDANGCITTCSVGLTQPETGIFSTAVNTIDVDCYGQATGAVTFQTSGGTPSYTILWSNGQQHTNVPSMGQTTTTGLSAGTYSLTITDANGCILIESFTIGQNPDLIAAVLNVVPPNCFGESNGQATYNPSGGVSPYYYSWDTGESTQTASGLSAGFTYTTVTDALGCSKTYSLFLSEPPLLTCMLESTPATCNGDSDGTATATVSGGVINTGNTDYQYMWSTGATTSSISNLAMGTYSLTVTDDNGCTSICSVDVIEPDLLVLTLTGTDLLCNGDSTGAIDMTVTGGNDCGPAICLAEAGGITPDVAIICYFGIPVTLNGIIDGTASGPSGYNLGYLLSNGAGIFIGSAINPTYTVSIPGNYTIHTIMYDPLTLDLSQVIVFGTTSVLDLNGMLVQGGGSICASLSIKGSAAIQVRNCQAFKTVSQSETAQSKLELDTYFNLVFKPVIDHNATLNNTRGGSNFGNMDTYLWSNGATTEDISGLAAGIYTVTVTDCMGCVVTASMTITEPPVLTATALGTNLLCNGDNSGSIDLTVTGGTPAYSYMWSNGMTVEDPMGLAAGTYSVTVTDDNRCTTTAAVTLTEPDLLIASATGSDLLCFEDSSGSIMLAVTGGTMAYSYMWSNGGTTANPTGLSAGTYMVTVTDANACIAMASVTLNQPTLLTVTASSTAVTCNGGSDGTTSSTVTGGIPAYMYEWSNGGTTKNITGLVAGVYTLTVTDANECTATTSVEVLEPPVYSCDMTVVADVTCHGYMDGIAMAGATGGTPGYTYQWDAGAHNQSTQTASGLAAGTYTVTITDNLGCPLVCTVMINQPPKLEATIDVSDVTCFSDSDGSAAVTATGGTSGYTYQWDMGTGGQTTATATGLYPGTYTVSVTDMNGCCYIASAVVDAPICDLCQQAEDGVLDICAEISTDPNHPLATLDCDNGGVMNSVECAEGTNPLDPSDDCDAAENLDLCALINGDPNHPLANADCDNGGVSNIMECNSGENPFEPSDDCQTALDENLNICALINFDPTHPLASLDCDNGGVINITECNTGEDPSDPADDCEAAAEAELDICAMILNGQPGWATLDCDYGGIPNAVECANGGDPTDPQDDLSCPTDPCEEAAANNVDVCDILAADPMNPIGQLDCDNGGVDNQTECDNGGDPSDPSDDCDVAMSANVGICMILTNDPSNPLADQDCDNGGVTNAEECNIGGDPSDPADDCRMAMIGNLNICALINFDPNHPLAQLDCDSGGVVNILECNNGDNPSDPADDCNTAIDLGTVCAIILANPANPIAAMDCDNGGINNATECNNGGDPADPADDCLVAIEVGEDICAIINGDPNHPMAEVDCDNGGIDNGTECANGGNPADPTDDCSVAKAAGVDVCVIIAYNPNHPLATLDCDNGGVDNYTECVAAANDPCDPQDDCHSAVAAGMDLCAILSANPGHAWTSWDCDNGGIDNQTECANGDDPNDPIDDKICPQDVCDDVMNGTIDICAILSANPNDPMGTMDCDEGGVDNQTECSNGGDPADLEDDCLVGINAGLDLCVLIGGDPNHPLADLDCDDGGVTNIAECANGGDPTVASDDCQSAMDAGLNICQLINYDPNHPLAALDCDNGGVDNWLECNSGGDPSDPIDDCSIIVKEQVDICIVITNDPTNPIGNADCDADGVINRTECMDNTDPLDPCDFVEGSITLPVTADQSMCPNLCPDLTPTTTILPGNIAGISGVCVSVEISELNTRDTDGSAIKVTMPSDPRFAFTWDPTLTSCGLLAFNNPDWTYLGNNGFAHTFEYSGVDPVISAGGTSTFGFAATYDPQSTDGQTTITATIRPFSGGECNILNNTDSERLVYFE